MMVVQIQLHESKNRHKH